MPRSIAVPRGTRRPPLSLLLAAAVLSACSTSSLANGGSPLTGDWGGAHAGLALTLTGGTISYDCASGGLSAPVVPDGSGDFAVPGVHVRGHGGPVRIGEVPDSVSARYVGRVSGDRMRLQVFVGADVLGPYDLQLGAPPQLVRCL